MSDYQPLDLAPFCNTGPELFPKAVAALQALLDRAGAQYR